jgi:hypothetical protein
MQDCSAREKKPGFSRLTALWLSLANCRFPRGVGAVKAGRRPPRKRLGLDGSEALRTLSRQRGTGRLSRSVFSGVTKPLPVGWDQVGLGNRAACTAREPRG